MDFFQRYSITSEQHPPARLSIAALEVCEENAVHAGAVCFSIAAAILGYGISAGYGAPTPPGMVALTLAILGFAYGMVLTCSRSSQRCISSSTFAIVLGSCLALQFAVLATTFPPMIRGSAFGIACYAG